MRILMRCKEDAFWSNNKNKIINMKREAKKMKNYNHQNNI